MIVLTHQPWSPEDDAFLTPFTDGFCIKLHAQSQRGTAGKETPGSLLCIRPDGAKIDDSYTVLASGDPRDAKVDAGILDVFESLLGYRPQGDTLAQCIADMLLGGSDPLGLDRVKPLVPTIDGRLEILCGGIIWSRAFLFGKDPHTNVIEARLQADFRQQFEAVQDGKLPALHAEKVLDYWCDKFQIRKDDRSEWERLVPSDLRDHVEGPVKHATTITDNFDGTDGSTIGNLLTWTEDAGDWTRVSNVAVPPSGATSHCHATSALSGTDHYAQVDIVTQGAANGAADRIAGPSARWVDSSNFYFAGLNNISAGTAFRLYERNAGVNAQIGTDDTVSVSLPDTAKIHCNGTTITGYWNGAALTNAAGTDSSHSGTLAGMWNRSSTTAATLDNFLAEDLAAGLGIPIAAYHYNHHLNSMC